MLSGVVAVLGAIASLASVLHPQVYRDAMTLRVQAHGQDWVTLVIGVPLLVVSLVFSVRGSLRAQLVRLGALAYFLYTYVSYTFGAAYNDLFLLYVAILSFSFFAFVLGMMALDVRDIRFRFSERTPEKIVAIYFLVFGLLIAFQWLSEILPAIVARQLPDTIVATRVYTLVIQALDLGLVIPLLILTGILLWRRKPWGYALAGLLLVKVSMLGLAVISMMFFMARAANPVPLGQVILFAVITVLAVALSVVFLWNLREEAA
jgi:hypothetical protein